MYSFNYSANGSGSHCPQYILWIGIWSRRACRNDEFCCAFFGMLLYHHTLEVYQFFILRADAVTSRNAVKVRRNKINASSSAGSVYPFAKGFLQLLSEFRRRHALSMSRHPEIFSDRKVVLHRISRRQDGLHPRLVAGLVVEPQHELLVRLRIDTHLRQSNVGSNRHISRTLAWTRF
jgi:hypothetical protein